jgi:hypothetical protein
MGCRLLILAVAASALACNRVELPEVPAGVPVSYAAHLEPLVTARCLGCHTREEPEAQLVFETGSGYEAMVGRASTQVPDQMLVVPGDPDASYLWLKLTGDAEIGKGMPRTVIGSIRLSDAELELYRRWIADGALP